MRYCPYCGQQVEARIPLGDERLRAVCKICGYVHYENPRLVLGAIIEWEGRILLCRRAIQPRMGLWTLPAGFMENGESSLEAAARETREEAQAEIEDAELFAFIDVPGIDQAHVFYRAKLVAGQHAPGEESLETALFAEAEIPWQDLAFPTISYCLEHYFADRRTGVFRCHQITLTGWKRQAMADCALPSINERC
ncbi:MAG: NUDIX hydrolase [Betaproteobacteria bacterium]|nr:NUDIX hydrolase [Betaproteobacteria bacterium]